MSQKYAAFDGTSGQILAFFDDSINSPEQIASQKTIPITDDQWQACIDSPIPYTVDVVNLVLVAPTDAVVLAAAQAAQTGQLTSACAVQIQSGFQSSALGAAYLYPLDLTSQSNMQAAVIRFGITTPTPPATINFMCADMATMTWQRRAHTSAQIMQVALEAMGYIEAVLAKKDTLTAQVAAQTTAAAVQGIAWTFP
ncbi:hypothetical protein [Paraburkholderia sp.]|uniref:DUF4376 domain-containing protein n=1 Tax=Paraburkholderia sp. TaxID=1926495 RepID=UPI003C7BE298